MLKFQRFLSRKETSNGNLIAVVLIQRLIGALSIAKLIVASELQNKCTILILFMSICRIKSNLLLEKLNFCSQKFPF